MTIDGKELYSIGEASKICHVSTKTLRFYDKIGVVRPDYVSKENGYRYYSSETLLRIPVIKYYKQLGFRLEEMMGLLNGESYRGFESNFRAKLEELRKIEENAHNSYIAVHDWVDLINEAKIVASQGSQPVSVKYISTQDFVYMDQPFAYDYRDSLINIPWTTYLSRVHCSITGAVILEFPSLRDKMNGYCRSARIMQRPVGSYDEGTRMVKAGGTLAVSAYHVGAHEKLPETYQKILDFVDTQGYTVGDKSVERYVLDYWTTEVPDEFVTEVIVPIRSDKKK